MNAIAGAGANNLGAGVLKEALTPSAVWLSNPTWVNHNNIWACAGVEKRMNPYRDASARVFAFEKMMVILEIKYQNCPMSLA